MATPLNEKASDDKDAPCPYRYDLVFNAVDPKLEVGWYWRQTARDEGFSPVTMCGPFDTSDEAREDMEAEQAHETALWKADRENSRS